MRPLRSPFLLAVSAALLLTAFFAVSELATLRGAKAHDASAYLTRELGSPLSRASLVREPARIHPALGGKLEIRGGGLRISSGDDTLSLRFAGDAAWRQYANGVSRTTAFGRETITFGVNRVEQSLLVDRSQGTKVWRWQLASNLHARIARDGSVHFADSPLSILPVAVLDREGRDITPAGLHWSLRGHSLELRLDDTRLPAPYVIDPVALVGACGGTGDLAGCSVHTVSNKTSFSGSPFLRPGSVSTGDLMLAQITLRNNEAITAPANWTQIGNLRTSGTGLEQALYYKIATAADTATTTYSWSWTTGADASGSILAYSGVDGTNPFDVTPSDNAGSSTSASATGLTTTQAGDMIVALYGAQGNVTATQDAGQTVAQEYTAISGSQPTSKSRSTGADATQASAGATGNKTATVTASAQWVAHLVALTPALASDGSGTMTSSVSNVSASQTGRTITFTYTAASGGMLNGSVSLVVPSGWSAPSTTGSAAGFTTASTGSVAVASQTITVSNVTLAGGASMTITYGSTGSGGPGATATSSTGAQTWQAAQKSHSGTPLTNLASSPSITVNAADGTGTLTTGTSTVSASQTGRTITFTYTAPTGGLSSGSVTLVVPSGWTAPSTTANNAGYTTASAGTVSVAGSTITVSSLTLAAGNTFTITYGDTSGGGSGATATSSTGAQTWQVQEKSTSGGSLANIASSPSITVYAADGAGTLTTGTSAVSASQTGRTITFTYTAPAGGISSGSVTLVVPSGWSTPSTTGSNAGYTTSSAGTLSVSSSTITVSSLTLAAGNTFTITYGSTASGGPGATATSSTGAQTWQVQEKSTSGGSLANIASSPSITVYDADGSGTMSSGTSVVSASQTGRTITFTYTAGGGGISNGTVTLVVPSGWSLPSTTGSDAGYTTASSGTVSAGGSTITVSSLTIAGGSTFTITYGSTASGGPGATATSSTGAQTWQVQEKSTSGGSLTNIGSSPSITVYAADGSGTMSSGTSVVSAGQTGRTITFTYTAAAGGISNGTVTLDVPSGWSLPSTTGSNAGYTTASSGTVSAGGSTITVSSLTLAGGSTFTITYGDTSSGGPGATATSSTGAQTWQVQEKSTSGGSLTNIGSSPSITVYAADGSGTLTTGTSGVSAGQTGRTITFTYTAAAGGISNGTVTLVVPSGWSVPSTTGSNAGYTTASNGTVSVGGSTITVSSLTIAGGSTFTITYGSTASGGPGATATSSTGAQTWQVQEKSTSGGSLTNIGSSPSITVYAADGSGTLTSGTSAVAVGSTGNTITFTYTAAAGGISNGTVTLDVPSGWSLPSTTGSNAGYTTASTGTVSVSSQTITVSSVTLGGGSTMTITYGSAASGGPGATATSSAGAQTWQAQEKSTSGGSLTNLGSSPSINVLAADGSGTLTTGTGSVNSASTGNTITFTYTAATGGLSNGSVTLAVPNGWSAPSTTGSNAGYTTASTGTVSASSQTITVSNVTLGGGSTFTITYGSTAGGGPGATAPVPAAAQTWQAQEKSSSGGTLTNLASSPAITVNDTTAPSAPGLTFGSFTNASVTGTTVYIRQGSAGGFTVTGSSGDTESGIDHLTFPSGFGAGWTGGGIDSSSPYNGVYTFSSGATPPAGSQNVTATNGWALTSSATSFTVVADTTAPSVTTPGVTTGYYTTLSVPVAKNGGTDSGSGVDSSTSVLERDEVALSGGSCGSFLGSWSTVTLVGGNDTSVVSGKCYRYRELLSDNVGNQGTSGASNTAKVDTSAPSTPTLGFSGLSANAYWDGSSTLYFRPSADGTFTATAASSDTQSGIGSYTFGTLNSNGGANWAGSQTGDHFDYTFDATTTAPGTARTVSAKNGANTSSADATYSIAADTTAPSVTVPSVTAGYYTSLSVAVTKNGGTDGGSGVDASTSVLERDEATLNNGTCGGFSGSWTTVTLSGDNDTSVVNGRCYEYRERISDHVGNQGTSGVSNIAKLDAQAPANSVTLSSISPPGSALKNGPTIYYRGSASGGGSFKLTNAVTDGESGAASSTTAALGGTTSGWSHSASTVSTPSGGPYESNAFTWAQGTTSSPTEVVTGADSAGNTTGAASLTFTNDSTAPTGGVLTVNGGSAYSASGSFPIDVRTDYTETQSATESGLAGSTLTRAAASLTNNSCGTYGSPTTIVGSPAQSLATGCYLYTLTGTDNVGNTVSISTTVKVDTSDPTAPTFTYSNFTGTTSAVGDVVFFLPTGSGSFDVTANSSDGDSGIASYTFPSAASFGSGWSVSGTGSTRTYSYTPGAATPGTQTVSTANNAGRTNSADFSVVVSDTTPPTTTIQCDSAACQGSYYTSSPVSVTLSADDGPTGSGVDVIRYTIDGTDPTPVNGSDYIGPIDIVATTTVKFRAYDNLGNEEAVASQLIQVDATPPAGQTITLTGAGAPYYGSSSASFTLGNGSDAESGLDLSSATVTRETGDLSGDSCSSFTADAGTFSSPDTSVSGGHCYRYSFTIKDNVGNTSTAVTATAKVDTADPSVTLTDPGTPVAGIVSLDASASDSSTAVQQVVFERAPAGGSTWTTIGTDSSAPYTASWNTGGVADGLYDLRAVATDTVGHTGTDLIASRRLDNTAPDTTLDSGPADPSGDATPTFSFSASEPGSSFECRIDSGGWSPCTSPHTTAALGEGSHTFEVRATDVAGNTDASPASSTWTIDLTAPNTTIDSSPSDPSGNATPSFAFRSSETGSSFECRLDGGSWSSCTSPHTTGSLTDGSHTFDVRATDVAGNTDGSPASFTWTVDLTAPQTTIDSSPASPTNDTTPTFSFSSSESGSSFECRVDGGSWSSCTSPHTNAALAEGTHTFDVRATDPSGNTDGSSASFTWTIDLTAPNTALDSGPGNPSKNTTPTFTFSASEPGSSFECRVDAGGWSSCTSPHTTASLGTGSHTFDVRATDPAGNTDASPASFTWTIDLTAPDTTIDFGPADPSNDTTPTFTFSASEPGSTFECRIDGGSWSSCTSPHTTAALGAGSHTFDVRATDPAGNTDASPASSTWTIDLTSPDTTIDSSPSSPSNDTTPTFGFSSSETGSSFECRVDGGSWASCTSPHATAALSEGTHTFDVRATDPAGNTDSSQASFTWTIDLTAPSTTLDSGPADPSNDTTPTFSFSASEPGSSFECRIDSGGWSPCTSPHTSAALGQGSHTFAVRATDPAGNTDASPATQTWTVDLTAPDTTIDSSPSDPSGNATPSFSFSSSETGSSFECRLDSGSWNACTSPETISPALSDGSYTFDVRATDTAGNTDTSPASHLWTVDLTAPNTTIDSNPSSPSNDTTPSFGFSSTEPGSSFECRIDGGGWTSCTSPHTTAALGQGSHTFDVRATDTAGNTDASPASVSWAIDLTAPNTTIDSGPADPSNDTTPTFSFSASEPGSSFECRVDGGGWSSCTSPHTTAALAEGSHTFDVRATDPAGNTDASPATQTWAVDLTAPDTTINSAPPALDNDATPTFTFSSSEPSSTFECRVDAGSWASCSSPHTTAALGEGSHTFDVRATDAAGNTDGTPATHVWSIDLGPPTVTITSPTTYVNASDPSTYTVTASTPDGDVTHVDFYECSNASVDCATGSWTQFDSDSTAPYSGSWSTPGSDGTRAIRAVAVDAALNTGEHVRTITIDRTPPSGVTVSYPSGYVSGSFAVTTNNGPDSDVDASSAALERQTGDLINDTCSSYGGWTPATSPDSVASGKCAQYRYRIADNAGNWTTATSANEVKSDTNAPTSSLGDPGANLRQTVALAAGTDDTGGSGLALVAFQRRPAGGGSWTTISGDTTAPYAVAFDTTSVADGLYDFRSVATDVAGNSEASPVVVANRRIDNTAPGATMLSPGDPVRGTVSLTSNTNDAGSGIDTVTYELAPHGGSFTTQPAAWDTTLGSDGLYDLRVTAADLAGNSTTSPVLTTRVDNTPPALTFSSPATGDTVSGTVSLTASASDASPATPTVTFAYKLHSDPPTAYTATGASWNTTSLPAGDGLYDLRARATDDATNVTTVENTSIRVDNVPPSVSITAPATAINGSLPSPTSFSATAGDPGGSGVAQVQFFECSNQSTDCATGIWSPLGTVAAPGPYTVSWNIPATDGNHALAAVATDNAGHPSSAIRNVDVDRTAPETTIVGKPGDPSNAASPTFTFSSSEPGSSFECRIDGGAWASCTSPHSVSGLTDNAHTFDVRATDPAGNTDPSPDTWTWHRDTSNPTGTLNNPGANIRQTVTLTSAESDPPASGYASGIASVTYEYSSDGTTWAPIGTLNSAPFDTILWNTTGVADGVYQVRVVVHDAAGNSAPSAAVTNVRIDNTPPTTSQDDPGPYLRATKTLTGSAADSGSGIDHVDFQRAPAGSGSWTTIATDTAAPYSVGFDTTAVSDGHYDFRTVAFDVAGNQAAATPVTGRLVDNTPPTATLNDPGAYLRGAVTLASSTSDPGGSDASGVVAVAYEYSTNGGATWQSTGSTFDSTSVTDGNVDLHVVATDAAGNSTTSAAVTRLVDNTKPSTGDNAPGGWQASPVTVTLTPTDAGSGVNVTEYSVDGNPTYTVGTSVVIPAPADGSNDGAHSIAYFSVDNAGNIETVKSTTVLIDATPPACPSCSAADYLRGTVTLSATPDPDGSGIKSVSFEYADAGGATWTTIGTDTTGPAPYTASWDTTSVPDGHYDLRILITDNADNVTTASLSDKVVDNTAPNVATVGAPTEAQVVTGTVAITASASDVTSPVASVEFLVRGSTLGTDTTAPFSFNWNTTTGSDGPATIQIVVTDMAGNSTTSAVRNVTVDNVAPTPTLADPGQNLSGTISLSASSDPDTVQVDFERRPAGGGSWVTIASDSSLPWGTSLDTTTMSDGLYDFRAVATDATGHTGTSPIRSNVRIDNTAPSGSLTAPAAGATVGGSSVTLSTSVSDAGSGVASVRYELRPTGGGSFSQIATSSSAPFSATWDATTVSTGSYDLRPVITDRAGNTFTGAAVTVDVDVTAPTVVLANPGANISGLVTLNATVSGTGATKVVFDVTPAGGATWTALGTDTSSPWSLSYDTTKLVDGLYDLRATVSDDLGNSSNDVVTGIRIDNTAPQVVSSSPAEGATVGSANAISLVVSEPATPVGVTLDGGSTVAPVVSGTNIDYGTGVLGVGPHTLAGELQDGAGKRAPFRVHFTVYASGSAPYVEKNTSSSSSTTVTSADGFAAATMPAGAWSSTSGDWLVLRIAPTQAPSGLTNGFGPGPEALDVTAWWALAGTQVHQFSRPVEIVIHSTERGLVPATYDGTAWRVIHRVPTPGTLPAGWDDGFFSDASGFHVLTDHLSLFALLRDLQPPQAPQNVRGYVGPDGLTIRWLPGSDNSGTYDYVTVFAGASDTGHYGPDYTAATVAGWSPGDSRIFRLQETDLAGNQSDLTQPLVQVPSLIGLTPDQAEAALKARGLTIGSLTVGGAGKAGTVTGPEGLALAQQGAAIDLTVAPGGASTSLVFKVVTAPKFKPATRKKMAARVTITRAARVTAQLFSPRGVKLFTWRFSVRAGRTIVKIRIPRQVRRPGIYSMRWSARAGRETVSRTIKIRIVGSVVPAQRIQIVLAGTAAKVVDGKLGKQKPKVVSAVEPTFDAAANRNRDVRVIVVDVDDFGVGVVRDLHAVFPSVKIVALAAGPRTMAAALKAGATIVLPRSTPPATLAKIIQRLEKRR